MTDPSASDSALRFSCGELLDAAGERFDSQFLPFFERDESLAFEVRWPAGEHAEAPGVLIYISPKPGARMPEAWGPVLDQLNLVWVGALDSGNEVHVARRVGFALMAPVVASRTAPVDEGRVVLSGFSGGGRVASMMVPVYPERYCGSLFICGANPMFIVDEDTATTLARKPMVFLTGTGDFNLEDTRFALSSFEQAGLSRALLQVVDGLGHALPDASDLATALETILGNA